MAWLSTLLVGLPMILKSFGSFSFTVARSGAGTVDALSIRSLYATLRPLGVCVTTPDAVAHSDSGTPHVCAAAVTSIARAAAPTRRIGIQFCGVAVLPPADWP